MYIEEEHCQEDFSHRTIMLLMLMLLLMDVDDDDDDKEGVGNEACKN